MASVHEGGVAAVLQADTLRARLDLGKRIGIADLVETDELEVTGLADGLDGGVRVGRTGNLNQDGVGPLLLDGRLRGTERVDAVLDDRRGGRHVVGAGGGPVRLVCRHDDRDAALYVEALRDALAQRSEADRCRHEHDREHH